MSEEQFTKLYYYLQDSFKELSSKIDKIATQESLDCLTSTIQTSAARLDSAKTKKRVKFKNSAF